MDPAHSNLFVDHTENIITVPGRSRLSSSGEDLPEQQQEDNTQLQISATGRVDLGVNLGKDQGQGEGQVVEQIVHVQQVDEDVPETVRVTSMLSSEEFIIGKAENSEDSKDTDINKNTEGKSSSVFGTASISGEKKVETHVTTIYTQKISGRSRSSGSGSESDVTSPVSPTAGSGVPVFGTAGMY